MIHFFTKGDRDAGSSRQRAFLVAEELSKRGIKSAVHQPPLVLASRIPWPKKIKPIWQYLKIFKGIKKGDIIYLQRTIYNKYFLILIVFYKLVFRRKMVFDFDDAIYLHSFFKTKILTKLANVVIVGSHTLADWAGKYNKNTYLIPTCLKFDNYKRFSKDYLKNGEKITIGWIGGAIDQYDNLRLLVPVFKRMIADGLSIRFFLIGALGHKKVYNLFRNVEGLDVKFVDTLDWINPIAVPSCIQKFDIGVMPLVDSEWNRGKCSFKAVEYMACGVASICSAVGENNYLIRDGENGFLANSTDEWADKIKIIYDNPELTAKIGREAQRTIKNKYSYEANIPILQAILAKI